MPDIKKTLEMVYLLKEKHAKSDKAERELETNFLISDNIWAKAKIPNETGKVGLWLGSNVMIEYSFEEAIVILERNFANAIFRL